MDKRKTTFTIAAYIFYVACAIQMLLGAVWMIRQFPYLQNWQSSVEYLDISQTFVMDEYTGPVYPALLRIFTEIERLSGLPFYMPVYLLQLAAAGWSGFLFAEKGMGCSRKHAAWAAGYLTSFPLLLQFHLSIRPESLAFSGGLLLAGGLSQICGKGYLEKRKEKRAILLNFLLSLLLIWLIPDLSLVVFCLWGGYLFEMAWKARKKTRNCFGIKDFGIRFLALFLALVLGMGGNALLQTPGSRGRIQKTFWAAAFQRVVTDYFSRSYAMWDEKVRTTLTIEEAMEMAKRSDNMMYVVGPMLERDWGKKAANESYKQMTISCFKVRTRDVVTGIWKDLVDSCLTPFSLWWQDSGERQSQAGWNYENFRSHSPVLARFYLLFSLSALCLLILLKLLGRVLFGGKKSGLYAFGFTVFIWAVYSVMSTGDAVDYGKLMWIMGFYCAAAGAVSDWEEKRER